ncbi:MAG: efflux transporter outer membrane subunit [Pseudomonadota bacterium]|nr:efflux transporter outer membrane subunit [Pseudomonadota bacterium]
MRYIVFVSLALTLSACVVGPTYTGPPTVAAAPEWTEPALTDPVDKTWWRVLGDPMLNELVQAAFEHNFDLRIAEAQVKEARANRDAIAGGHYPQVNAAGSATRNQLSAHGEIPIAQIPGFHRRFNLFDAGFDASWELDFWGRNARSIEAATARAESATDARRNIQLEVVAEVVRTYVSLRSAQARLTAATDDADAEDLSAALVSQQFEAGEASRSDALRSRAQASLTRSKIAPLQSDARAASYALSVLTGQPAEMLTKLLDQAPILPDTPPSVGVGLRSDLLRRRPDILQAERDLAAATADVGAQTAELFPRVSLLAAGGQQAQHTGDLFSSLSTRYQVGPSFSWPIFVGGQIRAKIRGTDARSEAAKARYERAVISAFADSETAINRYAAACAESASLQAARTQLKDALHLAAQRHDAGEDDLLALLAAQSQYDNAEQSNLAAQAAALTALASLYKALGGGWDMPAASADGIHHP